MKNKKWTFIVYVHAGLLLWALLFRGSLFIPDGGEVARILTIGNFLFLFINIPLSVFRFVLKAKDCFDMQYEGLVTALSILNFVIGIAVWLSVVLLYRMP